MIPTVIKSFFHCKVYKAEQTETQAVDFSLLEKVGDDEARAPTEVSALPACICIGSVRAPINSILGARRNP